MELKIFVDKKAKKVVFAEADKQFVDFIFQIMTLPLKTVTRLLKGTPQGMSGCLSSVYDSVNSLNSDCFEPYTDKGSVLDTIIPMSVPLLSLYVSPYAKLFKCPSHDRISFRKGHVCPENLCSKAMTDNNSIKFAGNFKGFVKSSVPFMVMDDLAVKPLNIALIKNYVNDFDYLEEKVVQFGNNLALAMLRASLQTNAVLTTVFLGKD